MSRAHPYIPKGCDHQGRIAPAEARTDIGAEPGEPVESATAEVIRVYTILVAVVVVSLLSLHFGLTAWPAP